MSHFTADAERSEATPREWLRCGAQIGDLVNEWSGRGDVVAFVGPGAGGNNAACFKPTIAEMEINVDVAFAEGIDPRFIEDLTERRVQFDWPKGSGAILHEAGHARHSLWSFETLNDYPKPLVSKLAVLFEESRIEARMVDRYPANRSFLRACALEIVIKEINPAEIMAGGMFGLSQLMLLTLARVDAGVLELDDVRLVHDKAIEILGEELLNKLRLIWREGQTHSRDTKVEPLLALGERWLELMPEIEAEQEALQEALAEILEALGAMAEGAEVAAEVEGAEVVADEAAAAEVAARAAASREQKDHEDTKDKLYSKNSMAGPWTSTNSLLASEREPTDKERAAASTVGRLLEKAKYHDRIITERSSAVPPGKMRMQAVMQGHIERSRGGISTVKPFRSKLRHHAIDPNLTVGVMVDISGSMSSAMLPMGVTAWMLSEAARRIDALCAMNYYGNAVFPVLKPGQHLDKVRSYTAPDNTEEFDLAFRATDGALNLLHGEGARLLVVVSDTCYRHDQVPKAQRWFQRCSEAGVAVLILPYDDGSNAAEYERLPGVTVLKGLLDPVAAASTIGMAAVRALEAASR